MRVCLIETLILSISIIVLKAQNTQILQPKSNFFINGNLFLEQLNLAAIDSHLTCTTLETKKLISASIETNKLELNKISANSIISNVPNTPVEVIILLFPSSKYLFKKVRRTY